MIKASTGIVGLQGTRARQAVSGWTWQAVALQYASLVSEGNAAPLGQDPFARLHFAEPSASWRGQAVKLLSGHAAELSAEAMPPWMKGGGSYALFVDVDIQVWLQHKLTAEHRHSQC